MLRWKQIIGLVALVGMLLHAGLSVRHSTMILAHKLAQIDLIQSLTVSCHGAGGTSLVDASHLPDIPDTNNTAGECPMCMGMASAALALPVMEVFKPRLDAMSARIEIVAEVIAHRMAAERPPSTGPPAVV